MGNITQALKYYDLCFENKVDVHNAALYKGKLLSRKGKYQEALKYLEMSWKLWPDHAEILYQNGKVCMALGQKEKALKHFNKAISIEPYNPNVWCNRGLCFIALGRKEEGLADLKRTQEEMKTFDQLVFSPGYVKFWQSTITSILEAEELGDKTKAVEEKLDKRNPEAEKVNLVLKKLHDDKEAMQSRLINQLGQQQSAEGKENIAQFYKLKEEFNKKLLGVEQEIMNMKSQIIKLISPVESKITNIKNIIEAMKEEINNKVDDFYIKLNIELDKQDLSSEDKAKLNGYFKAFTETMSSIYVISQVVDSEQVQIDAGRNAATILSTIASLAPFIGDTLSNSITSISGFFSSQEIKRNAIKVKSLALDATEVSQIIGKAAYEIVLDKRKQQHIINTNEDYLQRSFENLVQRIAKFCENLSEQLDVYLYFELYKTPAEALGHQDANLLIQKWIEGVITPFAIEKQFVQYTLNANAPPVAQVQQVNRSSCCNMF